MDNPSYLVQHMLSGIIEIFFTCLLPDGKHIDATKLENLQDYKRFQAISGTSIIITL